MSGGTGKANANELLLTCRNGDDALSTTLDMGEPVAVLLIAVLHFLPDTDAAYGVVKTLMDGLAAGSCLAVSHATEDFLPPETVETLQTKKFDVASRNRTQIDGFFHGLDLLPPARRWCRGRW